MQNADYVQVISYNNVAWFFFDLLEWRDVKGSVEKNN